MSRVFFSLSVQKDRVDDGSAAVPNGLTLLFLIVISIHSYVGVNNDDDVEDHDNYDNNT